MLFFSPLFLKARERFYFLFYFRTFASDYKADNMRRPQIIERIRKALGQVAPDAKAILYGSEARGDARPDSDIDFKNQST